jgi:hypothetical protein
VFGKSRRPIDQEMHGWFLSLLFDLYQEARSVGGRLEVDGISRLKKHARRRGG